jgi:hypothetical protein
MTDPPLKPDSRDNDDGSIPRWARVLAIVIVVLLVVFVIMHITGGGVRDHSRVSLTSERVGATSERSERPD